MYRKGPLRLPGTWLAAMWLAVLLTGGCAQRSGMVNVDPTAGWSEFVCGEGGFAVRLPVKPRERSQTVQTDAGEISLRIFIAESEGKKAAFGVMYMDYPEEVVAWLKTDVILDSTADDARANPHEEVVSFEPIRLGDVPGRAMTVRHAQGAITQTRVFLVGSRLYSVVATTLAERAEAPETRAFLDSFRVLGDDHRSSGGDLCREPQR